MEVRPGYKKTEVGVIPEDWDPFALGKGISLLSGHHILAEHCNTRGNGVPYLTGPADFPDGTILQTKFTTKPSALCQPEDILVTVKGSGSGSLVVADNVYCISRQLMAIRPREWNKRFVFYSLIQCASQFRAASTGLIPGLSRSDILEQSLPIPPMLEQCTIAAALSDLDLLAGALEALVAKKRDLKQAAMQQLLTGQTRLPGFSGEWGVNSLGDFEGLRLVRLARGQVISKRNIENSPGDFPIYSSSIHDDGRFGSYGKFMFDEELITWSVDGGGNFFYRPRHKFSVTNVCGFMRVDTSRISYRFLAAMLQFLHGRKNFDYQSKAHPSVIRKEYEVRLPILSEQIAIAVVLAEMEAEIEVLEQRLAKTRDLKQAMMQELLTGRIRLVPPEARHA